MPWLLPARGMSTWLSSLWSEQKWIPLLCYFLKHRKCACDCEQLLIECKAKYPREWWNKIEETQDELQVQHLVQSVVRLYRSCSPAALGMALMSLEKSACLWTPVWKRKRSILYLFLDVVFLVPLAQPQSPYSIKYRRRERTYTKVPGWKIRHESKALVSELLSISSLNSDVSVSSTSFVITNPNLCPPDSSSPLEIFFSPMVKP